MCMVSIVITSMASPKTYVNYHSFPLTPAILYLHPLPSVQDSLLGRMIHDFMMEGSKFPVVQDWLGCLSFLFIIKLWCTNGEPSESPGFQTSFSLLLLNNCVALIGFLLLVLYTWKPPESKLKRYSLQVSASWITEQSTGGRKMQNIQNKWPQCWDKIGLGHDSAKESELRSG